MHLCIKSLLTEELNRYIKELNLTEYVRFSPTLARGQEYYTGTIFEVYVADESIKSSIGGGGRYDNIIGEFINDEKKYPAVGISFGLDVIFEILREKQTYLSNTDVYIIPMENNALALKIADELRKNEVKVDIEMNNLKLKKALSIVNDNKVEVKLDIGKNIDDLIEIKNDFTCIKIDGILIAVLDEEKSKKYIQKLRENEEKTKNELKELMITKLKCKEKAIGIMLSKRQLMEKLIFLLVAIKILKK